MKEDARSSSARGPAWLAWPIAGLALGAIAGTNTCYEPVIRWPAGLASLFVDLLIALACSFNPHAAKFGVLVTGLFLAVPCFLHESPLARGLLMASMAFPFALVSLPLTQPPSARFRDRLVYVFTWLGTRHARRTRRRIPIRPCIRFLIATLVFAALLASVRAIPREGAWLVLRWLAGGFLMLATAEVATACHECCTALLGLDADGLMCSPFLSISLGEFWTRRWNPAASALVFRPYCFAPVAGRSPRAGLLGAFLLSAVAHLLGFYMATGKWGISFVCGSFFMVQPALILAERALQIRRWSAPARRGWTLGALALCAPLIVEPTLQLVEPSWDPRGSVWRPTLGMLAYVVGVTVCFVLGCFYYGCSPAPNQPRPADVQVPLPDKPEHREPIADPPNAS